MRGDNGRHWGTRERQDIEKANTSSNTGTHVGRQRETSGDKGREGGHTNQQKGNKKGDWETKGDKMRQDQGGHLKNALRTPRAVHCLENKKGDNVGRRGDKMLGKTDTPSNKRKQEGVQWETEGDKTLGKKETRRGIMGDKGRQDPREGGRTIQQGKRRRGTI